MLSPYQLLKSGSTIRQKQSSTKPIIQPEEHFDETLENCSEVANRILFVDDLKTTYESKEAKQFCLKTLTLLKKNRVAYTGLKVPAPLISMSTLNSRLAINPALLTSLSNQFGISSLTLTQKLGIPIIHSLRNSICIAPTGSGKTLTYGVPLIDLIQKPNAGKMIIYVPTFELHLQIFKIISKLVRGASLPIRVFSSHNIKEEEIEAADVLIGSPDRISKLLECEKGQEWVKKVKHVVFDEADKFFELNLMNQMEMALQQFKPDEVQWILVSATLPQAVEKIISNVFNDRAQVVIGGKLNVLNKINQQLVFCSSEEAKLIELTHTVNTGGLKVPCLIFAQSRERVRSIYRELKAWGIHAEFLDGALNLESRKQIIEDFEAGKSLVLITTDVLARGIDIKGLKMVINFDVPTTCVSYVHRVGRTGRAGADGTALTFYTPMDKPIVRKIAEMMIQSGCQVDEWLMKLKMPSKRQLEEFQKNTRWREGILPSGKKDADFIEEIKRRDGTFYKKLKQEKRENPDGSDESGEEQSENQIEIEEEETQNTPEPIKHERKFLSKRLGRMSKFASS